MNSTQINTVDSSSIFKNKDKKRTLPPGFSSEEKDERMANPAYILLENEDFFSQLYRRKQKGDYFFQVSNPPPPPSHWQFPYSIKINFLRFSPQRSDSVLLYHGNEKQLCANFLIKVYSFMNLRN